MSTSLAIEGLNHLTFAVADLDRSLDFYVDLLGTRLRARWDRGAYLSSGDLWLCLTLDAPALRDDYTHVAFSVREADMAHWHERIQAAGVALWQSNSSEGESIYLLDPDGHRLELHAGDLASRLVALREAPYAGTVLSAERTIPFEGTIGRCIVALAGSVRTTSINRAFVAQLSARLAGCETFCAFDRLPMFTPDVDRSLLSLSGRDGLTRPVSDSERALAALSDRVRLADVVLIACPEYAGGLSGAFKNGLDHLVGGDAFIDKPFVLYNLAPRASAAQAHLRTVLETMSGVPIVEAFRTLDVGIDADAIVERLDTPAVANELAGSLDAIDRYFKTAADVRST